MHRGEIWIADLNPRTGTELARISAPTMKKIEGAPREVLDLVEEG